jgi:hypothetical protein
MVSYTISEEGAVCIHHIRGLLKPRAYLNPMVKRNISSLPEIEARPSSRKPLFFFFFMLVAVTHIEALNVAQIIDKTRSKNKDNFRFIWKVSLQHCKDGEYKRI